MHRPETAGDFRPRWLNKGTRGTLMRGKFSPNLKIFWIILVVAALSIPVFRIVQDGKAKGNFAIYLTTYENAQNYDIPLKQLQLLKPLLTNEDIVEYRWQSHEMLLTDQGWKKFKTIPQEEIREKTFVVMANGERCYHGAFWRNILSVSYPYPVIIINTLSSNTIKIERAYPSEKFAKGFFDPRSDRRIFSALKYSGKLRQ